MKSIGYRDLVASTIPAIAAVGLEPVAEMIDTGILGQVNSDWVAGLASTNSFLASFAWVFNFLSYGLTAHLARCLGSGDLRRVGRLIKGAFILALTSGLLISVLLLAGKNWLLIQVLGVDQETYRASQSYWIIRVSGFSLTLLLMSVIGILRGLQQIRLTMIIILCMTLLNFAGSWIFVRILGTGPEGAAAATVLSFLTGNLMGLGWLWRKRRYYGLTLADALHPGQFIDFGKDALNIFGRSACLTGAFFLMSMTAARQGADALAAHQVLLQVWLFASFFMDGFAITMTSLGGKFIGEKNNRDYFILCRRLLLLCFTTGLIFSLLYLILQGFIIRSFVTDSYVISLINSVWPVIIVMQPLNGLVYILDGIMFSGKEFKFLRKRLTEGFVFLFLPGFLFSLTGFFHNDLLIIWLCLTFVNFYRMITSVLHYKLRFYPC